MIDGGVPGAEADAIGTKIAAEGHELLVDQGLDGAGVDGAAAPGGGQEMQGGGDERFAGAGGGVQDDVFVLEQFQHGGFLGGIELELAAFGVFEKASEQRVVAGGLVPGQEIMEVLGHAGRLVGLAERQFHAGNEKRW